MLVKAGISAHSTFKLYTRKVQAAVFSCTLVRALECDLDIFPF